MAIYVKNSELREEIALCREIDELTPRAVEMFTLMADRTSKAYTYKYPEDREDCISFAILDLCMYWRSYDPSKTSNPFAYFSSVIFNGFRKGWRHLGYHKLPVSKRVSLSSSKIFNL